MPRFIITMKDGESCEVDGLRLTAKLNRSGGKRIRLILDMPPSRSAGRCGGSLTCESSKATSTTHFLQRAPVSAES